MTISNTKKNDKSTQLDTISDYSLRKFLGYNIKRAFNSVQSDLQRSLKPFDLRMVTYSALSVIVENPGLRQAQVADLLDIERPNLVVIIDKLQQRELIVRAPVKTDRRAYSLHATLMGIQLHEKASKAVHAHERRIYPNFDQKMVKQLILELNAIEQAARDSDA